MYTVLFHLSTICICVLNITHCFDFAQLDADFQPRRISRLVYMLY